MNNPSPFRYPGGKYKMYKTISEIIQKNNLRGCIYIEPFAGGAGFKTTFRRNRIQNYTK
jgi:DNA adenine methylase